MRKASLSVLAVALLAAAADQAGAVTDDGEDDTEKGWRVAATLYGYAIPDGPDFLMVVAPVDLRRWLHVEGRYNYEALRTGSAFVGLNVGWGERLRLHLTPMVGAVFGALDGVAPALRVTLTWWKLDLYSEGEVVVDFGDVGDSFFYSWSELAISPLKWLRLGIIVQRNRVFETALDVQRGLFVGGTFRFLTATLYELNAGWTTPTYVGALGVAF